MTEKELLKVLKKKVKGLFNEDYCNDKRDFEEHQKEIDAISSVAELHRYIEVEWDRDEGWIWAEQILVALLPSLKFQ